MIPRLLLQFHDSSRALRSCYSCGCPRKKNATIRDGYRPIIRAGMIAAGATQSSWKIQTSRPWIVGSATCTTSAVLGYGHLQQYTTQMAGDILLLISIKHGDARYDISTWYGEQGCPGSADNRSIRQRGARQPDVCFPFWIQGAGT